MKKHFNLYTLILSLLFAAFAITGCANLFDENETSLTVTVTFNANDGSESPKTYTQEGPVGKEFQLTKNNFVRSDYEFLGWSKDSTAATASYKDEGTVSFSESTTLYAVWSSTECTFKITFDGNGGSTTEELPITQSFKKGEAIKLRANPFTYVENGIKKGFAGWAFKSDATTAVYGDEAAFTYDKDVTLYAIWKKAYTVTFYSNGGMPTVFTKPFTEGVAQALPTSGFTRNGHVLAGWSNSVKEVGGDYDYTLGQIVEVSEDKSLYAVWAEGNRLLYVSQDGSDDNAGTEALPFATLDKAIQTINTAGTTTSTWTVYIIGNVSGFTDISTFLGGKLVLEKATSATSATLTGDGTKEILKISCNVNVEIYGVGISNATQRSGNGGGLYINSASAVVTLKTGASISGNKATNGAGAYIESGTLIIDGGVISGNSASSCGGGVYVDSSGTLTVVSGSIGLYSAGNTAIYGGGVCNAGTVNIQGGVISYNQATDNLDYDHANTGYGGGLYNKGTINLTGATYLIENNKSASRGGGIYNVTTTIPANPTERINNDQTSIMYGSGNMGNPGGAKDFGCGADESNAS